MHLVNRRGQGNDLLGEVHLDRDHGRSALGGGRAHHVDKPRGHGGGNDAEQGDSGKHQHPGYEPAVGGHRVAIPVTDRRDCCQRPPRAVTQRLDVPVGGGLLRVVDQDGGDGYHHHRGGKREHRHALNQMSPSPASARSDNRHHAEQPQRAQERNDDDDQFEDVGAEVVPSIERQVHATR